MSMRIPDNKTALFRWRESIHAWAKITRENASIEFARALFSGILNICPILDSFSTWLMVGTGATVALMIANIDKILPILGQKYYRTSLCLLAVSMLFGFLQKYVSIMIFGFSIVDDRMRTLLEKLFKAHSEEEEKIGEMAKAANISVETEIDLKTVSSELEKAFPWYIRRKMIENFYEGQKDQLLPYRLHIRTLFRQGFYVVMQFIFLILFIVIVALKM